MTGFLRRPAGRIGAVCLVAALLAGACTTRPDVSTKTAQQVFSVALETLDDRYIEPVKAENIMLAGLHQLSLVDDHIAVIRSESTVVLTYDGDVISEHATPSPHHIEGWSELGAAMIDDARRVSGPVAALSEDKVVEQVFHGFVDGLDRYSRYLPPDDARNSRASREGFGGIGIQIGQVDGEFVIQTIFPGRPATDAGLRADDRITHVDGHPIRGLSLQEVVKRLRGRVGDAVRLTVQRAGFKAPIDREIIRDYIVASTVTARQNGRVLEISLTGFNTGTVGALRRAIVKTAREIGPRLAGVVLDLRGNPGGLLDQAIAVSDLFLTRGRIISTKGRHPESNQLFDASPGEVLPNVPMVVVVNGRSASAAEIVAVALRDSGRAAIVGSTSYGKGTVQTIIRLPNQGELNVTWARILAPSGQTLDRQGIVPAICTNVSQERLKALIAAMTENRKASALDPLKLRIQARLPHFSVERLEACRPSDDFGARDMEAARLLLVNEKLYASAVARLAPNIAARQE